MGLRCRIQTGPLTNRQCTTVSQWILIFSGTGPINGEPTVVKISLHITYAKE